MTPACFLVFFFTVNTKTQRFGLLRPANSARRTSCERSPRTDVPNSRREESLKSATASTAPPRAKHHGAHTDVCACSSDKHLERPSSRARLFSRAHHSYAESCRACAESSAGIAIVQQTAAPFEQRRKQVGQARARDPAP